MECVGAPQEACEAATNQAGREAAALRAMLVQIRISCTSAAGCSETAGDVQYEAVLSTGASLSGGYAWAAPGAPVPGGPGPPGGPGAGPAFQPTCIGVPVGWCRNLATGIDADMGLDASAIDSVVLRCSAVCTDTTGEGETVITLNDGTRHEAGWSYEGIVP
jgi:hypothetical protein